MSKERNQKKKCLGMDNGESTGMKRQVLDSMKKAVSYTIRTLRAQLFLKGIRMPGRQETKAH